MRRAIANFDELATTPLRADALAIAEAAYERIDTGRVVRDALRYEDGMLRVGERSYDLRDFDRVRLIGFGKASCRALQAAEEVLRGKVHGGIAIDVRPGTCEVSEVVEGSHPHPTPQNVAATGRIVEMASDRTERDLFVVFVSGGGSSLLCYPYDECDQGARLYEELQESDATITDMNAVRKHLSALKGGGLASLLYPATVVALIFCDVPGERYEEVASGPTFFDPSTVADAQAVLDTYRLSGYSLRETPKDKRLFERVYNHAAISNVQALAAMQEAARRLGYEAKTIGADLYDDTASLARRLCAAAAPKIASLAGGEPRLRITRVGGRGGRCQHTCLEALPLLGEREVFVAFASDGRDNSEAAGAIVDAAAVDRAAAVGVSPQAALEAFDSFAFFEKTGGLLRTGPTDANVSDLFILLRG